MSALVFSGVVTDGGMHIVDALYKTRIQRATKRWGVGTSLVVRIEPEEEAWRHGDVKHLFGHVYGPVVDYTGYSKTELHLMAKSLFMPEGKTSLTDLNRDEMREYTEHVERWLREEIPDAYALHEPLGKTA